jgi:hypothetical protein
MKRKDMIHYMENLCLRKGLKPWNMTVNDFCDELLEVIEQLGMLPPERTDNKESPTGYGAAYLNDEEILKNVFYWKHSWEDYE